MKVHPEAWRFVFIGVGFLGIFTALNYQWPHWSFCVLQIVFFLFILFCLYFFRDPERKTPEGEGLVISPADGTIVKIENVHEKEFFGEEVQRVSVFLSVLNVHVNRIPAGGTVKHIRYVKGKFYGALYDKASELNEQSIIGVETPHGKILFKQIAGLIARRIIYWIKEGDQVETGKRFGLIRFGSRMDIYLPKSAKIQVSVKDRVKAGETVLGSY